MPVINPRTRELEADLDEFFLAMDRYLSGERESFEARLVAITAMEREADSLRRDLKFRLYRFKLIPDFRGDVLGILETMDNVIDAMKKVTRSFSIEKPVIPGIVEDDFRKLSETAVATVKGLVKAVRLYFTDFKAVNDSIQLILDLEHQADTLEETIKRKIFAYDEIKEFSRKVHVRYFAERVALVSDEAQAVAERLAVSAIKRGM